MRLALDHDNFYETLKEYDHYGSTIELTKDSIPDGATMTIAAAQIDGDDYLTAHVGRVYPFNDVVKAARKDMIAISNLRNDTLPATKFAIEGWTAERTAKHRELTRKCHEATKVYAAALEAQRLEITGETS